MKKRYVILFSLMFLNGMSAKEIFSDAISEHDEKVVVPSAKKNTTLFDFYQNGNVKEVSKEFANHGDPLGQIRGMKDEAVAQGKWDIAQQALRDEELIKGAVESEKKVQTTSQWFDRGVGFAAGFGSLAVSLALYYLFQKSPDNGQTTEFMRNINHVLSTFAQNGKTDAHN